MRRLRIVLFLTLTCAVAHAQMALDMDGATDLAAKVIPCWPLEVDLPLTLPVQAGRIELPAFTRGMILRIDRP